MRQWQQSEGLYQTSGRGGHDVGNRSRPTKFGLNKELEGNVFDLGKKSSADLLRTTQIKIAQYIGSQYGGDIMGELEMKKEFVSAPPQYPLSAIQRQPDYEKMIWQQQQNNLAKLQRHKVWLQAAIVASMSDSNRADLQDDMFDIDNEIIQVKYNISADVKVPLTEEEKGEWKTNKKHTVSVSRNTYSTSKRIFPSSSGSVRNAYKIRCTMMINGKTSIKSKNHWSFMCEIYCTTALTLQPYFYKVKVCSYVFEPKIASPRFSRYPF